MVIIIKHYTEYLVLPIVGYHVCNRHHYLAIVEPLRLIRDQS